MSGCVMSHPLSLSTHWCWGYVWHSLLLWWDSIPADLQYSYGVTSVVVVIIVMEYIENEASSMLLVPTIFWKRFVDNICLWYHQTKSTRHSTLLIRIYIWERSWTCYVILDVEISCVDGSLTTKVYRKPAHTAILYPPTTPWPISR